ncbi:hypothetical protein [Mesorhizobium sp. M0244]|uniref:hypothetical protein n=1 Tax=Mesorhizobium sp. M0244 TaxID=2956926 RepID=UPI00333D23ED
MKGAVKNALALLQRASRDARSDLDAIRSRIEDLQAERHRIEAAPDDIATIERQIDRQIEAAIKADPLHFPILVRGNPMHLSVTGDLKRAIESNPFAVLAALDPARMKAAMLATMPRDGLTPEVRSARLAQIDADILSSEVAEEVACREVERALGADLPRRPDANPAIILAPDAELGLADSHDSETA